MNTDPQKPLENFFELYGRFFNMNEFLKECGQKEGLKAFRSTIQLQEEAGVHKAVLLMKTLAAGLWVTAEGLEIHVLARHCWPRQTKNPPPNSVNNRHQMELWNLQQFSALFPPDRKIVIVTEDDLKKYQ